MSTAAVPTPDLIQKPQPVVAICEHIRDNGRRCGTPAIRGFHFCYHHSRAHAPAGRVGERGYRAPLPETMESLQLQLQQITEALGSGRITHQTAGKLLYAVQLSANLLKMKLRSSDQPLGAPFKPSVGLSGVVDSVEEGAPFKPSVGLSGVVAGSTDPDSSDSVTEIPPSMCESLTPRPLSEEEQRNPDRPSDIDPDMPQTIEEAKRAHFTAEQFFDNEEATRRCDPLSPRYAKLRRRMAIHRRAHQILLETGVMSPNEFADDLAIIANLREHKRKKS